MHDFLHGRAIRVSRASSVHARQPFFFVFTQVDGGEHKGRTRRAQGQNSTVTTEPGVEQRGVDVGGIVKDVIDERQDEQNLELGRAFDRQTGVQCHGPNAAGSQKTATVVIMRAT